MNKEESQNITNDVMLADLLVRVKTIENILISKNIISEVELTEQLKHMTEVICLSILEKANVSGDLNEIINSLSK